MEIKWKSPYWWWPYSILRVPSILRGRLIASRKKTGRFFFGEKSEERLTDADIWQGVRDPPMKLLNLAGSVLGELAFYQALSVHSSFLRWVRLLSDPVHSQQLPEVSSPSVRPYPFTAAFCQFSCLLLLSHLSHVRLCVTPKTAAHQAPLSLGFSRQEHWSGLPFPSPMNESEKCKWSHSVVFDSSRPHGLQPTRLPHPWDFPGKSTGVGCHCLTLYK